MPRSDRASVQSIHVVEQRYKLRVWIRTRLWAQVMLAIVAGFGTGIELSPDAGWLAAPTAEIVAAWMALPGQLSLGLIAMVLVPLIFGSIVGGLTGAPSGTDLAAEIANIAARAEGAGTSITNDRRGITMHDPWGTAIALTH
jgi:L-cystine uptake protein TcyP (sodium:dicarboxylate symporter family)